MVIEYVAVSSGHGDLGLSVFSVCSCPLSWWHCDSWEKMREVKACAEGAVKGAVLSALSSLLQRRSRGQNFFQDLPRPGQKDVMKTVPS